MQRPAGDAEPQGYQRVGQSAFFQFQVPLAQLRVVVLHQIGQGIAGASHRSYLLGIIYVSIVSVYFHRVFAFVSRGVSSLSPFRAVGMQGLRLLCGLVRGVFS